MGGQSRANLRYTPYRGEEIMPYHNYLDEDGEFITLNDVNGVELHRFRGADALQQALVFARQHGYELRSTSSPIDLMDNQRLYFRRRPRFSRLIVTNPTPNDPPNVQRIVVPDWDPFEDIESLGVKQSDDAEDFYTDYQG